MSYPLLEKAPKDHSSDEFMEFLRANNKVVKEDDTLLIIENCKYHTPSAPWYTVFFKCENVPHCSCITGAIRYLNEEYGDWEWLKKASSKQTVKRFHIHLIKK